MAKIKYIKVGGQNYGLDAGLTAGAGISLADDQISVSSQLIDTISTVYKFKGSVANEDALPTTGREAGDVWNASDTGANYAWTGNDWDKLSESIIGNLATVATTGNYNDLNGKPTIPEAYELPAASASTLGGVKVGTNLSIDANGTLSATGGGTGGGTKTVTFTVNNITHTSIQPTKELTTQELYVVGNARGDGSVDLQMNRESATQVASGNYSVAMGDSNTVSADYAVAIGHRGSAEGDYSAVIGGTAKDDTPCNVAAGVGTVLLGARNGKALIPHSINTAYIPNYVFDKSIFNRRFCSTFLSLFHRADYIDPTEPLLLFSPAGSGVNLVDIRVIAVSGTGVHFGSYQVSIIDRAAVKVTGSATDETGAAVEAFQVYIFCGWLAVKSLLFTTGRMSATVSLNQIAGEASASGSGSNTDPYY